MTDLDAEGLYVDHAHDMRLWLGGHANPLHLEPHQVRIEDIAHALARQCRYNGHCNGFLSVARHSLWVSRHLDPRRWSPDTPSNAGPLLSMWGLLHDAAEAYLGDLIRPLKHNPEIGTVFGEAEARLEAVIASRFHLPYPMPPEVKEADNYVLLNYELCGNSDNGDGARWSYFGDYSADEADFLARFEFLERILNTPGAKL